MARIRSAKPEWWSKVKWCALPRDVRFTYKGIWEVMADDFGRFQADTRLIKGNVWPLDDDITTRKLEKWLALLEAVTLIDKSGARVPAVLLYVVDGVRYGFLPGFEKHQIISHPTASKLPAPPESFRNGSGTAPESFRPEEEEDVDFDFDLDVDQEEEGRTPQPVALAKLVPKKFWPDVVELVARVPNPGAWTAEILATPSGLNGGKKPPNGAQIGQAIRDYNANEADANLAHFRGYLRRSTAEPKPPSSRSGKQNTSKDYDYSKTTDRVEDVKWQKSKA
jgi:hypothetical protein